MLKGHIGIEQAADLLGVTVATLYNTQAGYRRWITLGQDSPLGFPSFDYNGYTGLSNAEDRKDKLSKVSLLIEYMLYEREYTRDRLRDLCSPNTTIFSTHMLYEDGMELVSRLPEDDMEAFYNFYDTISRFDKINENHDMDINSFQEPHPDEIDLNDDNVEDSLMTDMSDKVLIGTPKLEMGVTNNKSYEKLKDN